MATSTQQAVQAFLPALIAAVAAWFLNLYEARSSPFNLILMLAAYALGLAALRLAQREFQIKPTSGLFILHILLSLVGVLLAVSLLRPLIQLTIASFALLIAIMFALPAVSEYMRTRHVQS